MRGWIPLTSSARGRLVLAALDAFAVAAYDEVGVGELAAAAEVTTGSIYHHFGNKLGLYDVVRADVERRVLDRLEGAVAACGLESPSEAATVALLAAFDFLTREGLVRFLAVPHPARDHDPIEGYVATLTDDEGAPTSIVLVAAWRAALLATLRATDVGRARAAFGTLRLGTGPPGPRPDASAPQRRN